MTVMLRRAATAQMARGSRGLERGRKKDSGNRKQQQESCDQALHLFRMTTPSEFSIPPEQKHGVNQGAARGAPKGAPPFSRLLREGGDFDFPDQSR